MASKKSGKEMGNGGQRRNAGLRERDIEMYKRHMRGESVRAIGEVFGLRSSNSVWVAIERGREAAKVKGIDIEEHRIEINELLRDTIGLVAEQVRYQATHGLETFFVDQDGNKSMKRVKGIDPRLAAELGRSAQRWAEFLGLSEKTPEMAGASQTTLIQLSAPSAGTDFESRYSDRQIAPAADQQTIDAHAVPVKEGVVNEGGPGWQV